MSDEQQVEYVLVVPTTVFHECGYFQGFSDQPDRFLPTLLAPESVRFMPRPAMEADPSFKQLIPYCVFEYVASDGQVSLFQYSRGSQQGEARLHSKRSIGVGGHISSVDQNGPSAYNVGLRRELEEELDIDTEYTEKCVGLINDDENEVGKVHLGVVHVFRVESPRVQARETGLADAGFVSVSELLSQTEQFETWSQICLRAIYS